MQPRLPAPPEHPSPSAAAPFSFLLRAACLSGLVLIPCFWQTHPAPGDLASHLYNSWLAQLIARRQAPGLWLAHPASNILFDAALTPLANWFGFLAAEKIAVSSAVLIFFWGAFALAASAAGRPPWPVAPLLAMLAYGWTFQMGFLNYYLSVGFAFLGIALLWRAKGRKRAAVLILVPLIWLAHPLGLILLAAAGAWTLLAQKAAPPLRLIAASGAVIFLFALRFYFTRHFPAFSSPEPLFGFNGADQLLLYGPQYRLPLILLAAVAALAVFSSALGKRAPAPRPPSAAIALQLYGFALLSILLMPEGLFLPAYAAPAGFLHERLSLICAVFALCALACLPPRAWLAPAFAAVACLFFSLLYRDTAKINRLEDQAVQLLQSLPPGARLLSAIETPPGSRVLIFHLADRACIGRCFSYGNYEPASRQFRIRANPGNPFVTPSMDDSIAIQRGQFALKPALFPAWALSNCYPHSAALCLRPLAPGELNGSARPPSRIP